MKKIIAILEKSRNIIFYIAGLLLVINLILWIILKVVGK